MKYKYQSWMEPPATSIPASIQTSIGGHPLIAETLIRRGISTVDAALAFLDPNQFQSASPRELPDLEKAVGQLQQAISRRERILIWGDFDVDGQTSTTLLFSSLRRLGADVTFHIPIRGKETHGISVQALSEYLSSDIRILLTCDTGISAADAVEYASAKGVDTIITDHHSLPVEYPKASSIVSSQRVPAGHPLSGLCGVGVAYKLLEELFNRMGSSDLELDLDLVALGTVADIALLIADNRHLVQRGLERIRKEPRLAIRAMLKLSEINHERISEEHISFFLAPRLNALGRLDDANLIVDFFMTKDFAQAEAMALRLEKINDQRKLESDLVFKSAQSQINRDRSLLNNPALVLGHPDWPASVVGVVASRLAELYFLPVILFSTPPGKVARGSARSVEGINIIDVISAQKENLVTFGGHPMAAGLSMDPGYINDFRRAINREISRSLQTLPTSENIQIDSYVSLQEISLDLVADIDRLAPFGPGNPPITLATRDLNLLSFNPVGKNGDHLSLVVEDSVGNQHRVIWWQGDRALLPEGRFDMAYTVRASNYRGQNQVQIEWVSSRNSEEFIQLSNSSQIVEIFDYRQLLQPHELLKEILSKSPQVFSEGENCPSGKISDRYHLEHSPHLVIWNLPCGRTELLQAINRVAPEKIYLFANDPGSRSLTTFLSRIGGLIRYAISHHQGWVDTETLVAETGQREINVRKAVDWYISKGDLHISAKDGNKIKFSRPGLANSFNNDDISRELSKLLDETEAYRAYYFRAAPYQLVT